MMVRGHHGATTAWHMAAVLGAREPPHVHCLEWGRAWQSHYTPGRHGKGRQCENVTLANYPLLLWYFPKFSDPNSIREAHH